MGEPVEETIILNRCDRKDVDITITLIGGNLVRNHHVFQSIRQSKYGP